MRTLQRSAEWRRIDAIPRRPMPDIDLTASYRTPGGTQRLRPVQSAALHEIEKHGGLLGAIGVGEGKTLITLLTAEALGAKRPLLLLPAKLIRKTLSEIEGYAEHWRFTPPAMQSYETLGRVNAAKYLETEQPDCIIADECQRLKNRKAAVTRRVLRYIKDRNAQRVRVPCVLLSGTLTRRSLLDYWHLAMLALPDAPLPDGWPELTEWADAIDEGVEPFERMHPGPLLEWGPPDEPDPVRRARLGYQRRLRETPGVVATSETELGTSLAVGFLPVEPPEPLNETIKSVQETWTRPDGYEFADRLSLHRYLRQLALGFYYRWAEPAPLTWLDARARWVAFVRDVISRSRKYDSELQVALACNRNELEPTEHSEWIAVRDTFKPRTECVWVSDFALRACEQWLRENSPGLVWVEHTELGRTLSELTKVEYHGEAGIGVRTGLPIESKPGASAILSTQANGEGRNLQAWCRNLITSCPSAADKFEQLLGRTHRLGQTADTVTADVLVTHEIHATAFAAAREGARYLEDSLGQKQKLLYCDIIGIQ